MEQSLIYVGLDVHKASIVVAIAEGNAPAKCLGTIPNDLPRLLKILGRVGSPSSLRLCYEAGPTGYGVARDLRERGFECEVIAPSKTPVACGDRVKTDRRDAKKLAHFLRAGLLTPIRIPTPAEEALRDISRLRESMQGALKSTKNRLQSLMLRHGRTFTGTKSPWTKAHMEWLHAQKFAHRGSQETRDALLAELDHQTGVVADLDQRVEAAVEDLESEQQALVSALCALRGVKLLTAAAIVSEIGDLRRFEPRQFASFLGLTSSEHSSAQRIKRGRITKAGNLRVRRLLVEAAQACFKLPYRGRVLEKRSEGVSQEIRDLSWRVQRRLHRRARALLLAGKNRQVVAVALARELACFICSIGHKEAETLTQAN